ncbi:putative gamma-glutamyl cyclotransferase, gamma-glutamylcyclotransferase [Septoria linicola]|nr:putative gamma-glutamyl cyclotransferase, gamma-glutamylcyclotransferase [Septoria linicola]
MVADNKPKKTIYFGYGSNLWLHQMRQRCPTSKYLGIARLKGYKWFIYDRGYANIVKLSDEEETRQESDGRQKHDYRTEVWGLVYGLEASDEARLDVNEGVAHGAYSKEWIECEFWTASSERTITEDTQYGFAYAPKGKPDTAKRPGKEDMLVYINRDNVRKGEIKHEYIYRMNQGIKDAINEGLAEEYVKQVLRKWIPEEESDANVSRLARKQAAEFGHEA